MIGLIIGIQTYPISLPVPMSILRELDIHLHCVCSANENNFSLLTSRSCMICSGLWFCVSDSTYMQISSCTNIEDGAMWMSLTNLLNLLKGPHPTLYQWQGRKIWSNTNHNIISKIISVNTIGCNFHLIDSSLVLLKLVDGADYLFQAHNNTKTRIVSTDRYVMLHV